MPRLRQVRTRPRPHVVVAVAGLLALALVSCSSADDGSPAAGGDPASGLEGSITVSAASSLTESFGTIAADFEAANPGTTVELNFDSSDALARQIVEGAPVDVFASASQRTTDEVVDAGLVAGGPTTFARNRLAIVTKPGNPEGIGSLADLVDAGVISLCGEDVPCGVAAATALEAAGVAIDEGDVTRGQNVKATLGAVADGDAVAGLVYVTDARAAGDAVEAIDLPEDQNAIAVYPISVVAGSADAEVAQAFVDQVLSDEGQRVLAEAGFLPPA